MLYNNPTPLEQAYASFLLKHHVSSLPISGRDGVRFLTKSNLSRSLLRECWNVVDPQQDGKLLEEHQWWTLLKLVALAQQQQSRATNTDISPLLHQLHSPCALPVFDTVVIPSSTVLLQEYGSVPAEFNASPQQTTSLSNALDELGPLQDAPLPSLIMEQQSGVVMDANEITEQEEDDFGDFENAPVISGIPNEISDASAVDEPPPAPVDEFNSQRELHTLSNALEEVGGGVNNVPLPSLDVHQEPLAVDSNNDDDFGDFEAPPPTNVATISDNVVFDDSANDEMTTMAEQEVVTTNGVFSTAVHATVPLSFALDELATTHDAPLPSLDTFAPAHSETNQQQQQQDDDMDEDFGDFTDAPTVGEMSSEAVMEKSTGESNLDVFSTSTPAVVPLSSALDELGATEDAPLPSLNAFASVSETDGQLQQRQDETSDDDFGDFADAPVVVDEPDTQQGEALAPSTDSNQFDAPTVVPLASAFDELGPSSDAPLPSLDAFAAAAATADDDHEEADEKADEFGEFTAPKNPTPEVDDATDANYPLSSALDALGTVENAPLPSLGAAQSGSSDADDFGTPPGVETTTDIISTEFDTVVPAPVGLMSPGGQTSDDPVGGFQDTASPPLALSSALDELGSSNDAPLPSLDTFAAVTVPEDVPDEDLDDDFGDFEDAPTLTSPDTNDAPPHLEKSEDDFGDFSDAPRDDIPRKEESQGGVVEFETTVEFDSENHDDLLSSAFESLGPTQDAPLRPLESHAQDVILKSSNDADEDFGDFEEPRVNEQLIGDGKPRYGESNDPLGSASDMIAPVQNKLIPSLEIHDEERSIHQPNDDSFGDFEDARKVVEVETQSDQVAGIPPPPPNEKEGAGLKEVPDSSDDKSDDPFASAFDSIAPIENSPLPPLGLHKTAPPDGEDDVGVEREEASDFGDFEDAPIVDAASHTSTTESVEVDRTEVVDVEPADATTTPDDADPFSVAFDTFAPAQDNPLPPLGATASSGDHKPVNPEDTQSVQDGDDFGDFEDAVVTDDTKAVVESDTENGPEQIQDDNNDATREIPHENAADDPFSAFDGPADALLPALHSTSGSDFSGFETASENVATSSEKGEPDLTFTTTERFGNFSEHQGSIPDTSPSATADMGDNVPAGIEDDFGDFTAVETPVVEDTGAFDTDWGDFEEPDSSHAVQDDKEPNETMASLSFQPSFDADFGAATPPVVVEDDEFGDFDSFQQVEHPVEKEETLEEITSRVREMQSKLNIRASHGGSVDFTKSFGGSESTQSSRWFNNKIQKANNDPELLERVRRCYRIMSLLTISHEKNVQHWEKMMNVARDELAMGSFLLEEAKSLLGEDVVLSALGIMVAGLGEYVRVVRLIAATLCDLLGVDVNGSDSGQLKNHIQLLDSALEIEDLWSTVQEGAKSVGLEVPAVDSISEIRSKGTGQLPSNTILCQLTLQPLSEEAEGTTVGRVVWNGKSYMACAANFWANRISTSPPL